MSYVFDSETIEENYRKKNKVNKIKNGGKLSCNLRYHMI